MAASIVMLDLKLDQYATAEHISLVRGIRASPLGTKYLVNCAQKLLVANDEETNTKYGGALNG